MASLPEDVISEILSRLPSKSLTRFRCVCKPWCKLTSDSTFIQKRLCRFAKSGEEIHLLFSKMERFSEDVQMSYLDDGGNVVKTSSGLGVLHHTKIYCVEGNSFELGLKIQNPLGIAFFDAARVVGSCNGIVCLVRVSSACLWNPCTTEYKIVKFGKSLKFEYAVCGFGYDSYNDDYKLVKLCGFEDYTSRAEVYSLKDASCLIISDIPYKPLEYEVGIFFNQAIHWVAKTYSQTPFTPPQTHIISFDVEKNTCLEVPKPASVDPGSYMIMGVLGGQFCMLSKHYRIVIEVWVMEDYGVSNSWKKLFAIKKTIVGYAKDYWPSFISYNEKYLRPLCFSSSGELLLKDGDDLLLYDPLTETARSLKVHDITDYSERYKICNYVPSLVTLNSATYSKNVLRTEGQEIGYLRHEDSVIMMKISRDVDS